MKKDLIITPSQVRAGRALLDWTRDQLALASGVSIRTLHFLEKKPGYRPKNYIQQTILTALNDAGVEIFPGGVMFRDGINPRADIEDRDDTADPEMPSVAQMLKVG